MRYWRASSSMVGPSGEGLGPTSHAQVRPAPGEAARRVAEDGRLGLGEGQEEDVHLVPRQMPPSDRLADGRPLDPESVERREHLPGRSPQRERDHLHGDPLQPQLLGDEEAVRPVDHPAIPEDAERRPDPVLGDVFTEHPPLVRRAEVGRPDEARLVERQRGQRPGLRWQGSGEAEPIRRHHSDPPTGPSVRPLPAGSPRRLPSSPDAPRAGGCPARS